MNKCKYEINLTENESKCIRDELANIKYDPTGSSKYITAIRMAAYKSFPLRIIQLLERQKASNNPLPYLIFNGMPIDENVYGSPKFTETGSQFKSGNLSENVACAIAALIGEPYAIYFEGMELINNLTPQRETKTDYTGLGSEVELDFHIENAALRFMAEHDYTPMGLILLGVRNDPNQNGPKTLLADARAALRKLSKADIETLYGNNFIIRLPHRWRKAFSNKVENTKLCPLISGPIHLPQVSTVFYSDMVLPINKTAQNAFKNLYNAIKATSIKVDISPGKLVYIDNRFVLHAREKFKATYDRNNNAYRWLQRTFVSANLWNYRAFYRSALSRDSRIFDPSVVNTAV